MDREKQRTIAHQMVDLLFDMKENEDTVIWEEAEIDNLQIKRTFYRLTFNKLID